ncbi:MAG: RNA 2',3'-cyclic phosphodiesterase [Candidatus Omnitrophota bacterium]
MRLFIAVDIPEAVKKELAAVQGAIKRADADVKWVCPDRIHLTLKFLGETDENMLEGLKGIMDKAACNYKGFELSLFRAGAFPALDSPRVLWMGIDGNCAVLEKLAREIDDLCAGMGFAGEERRFSAHLTIGRLKSSRNRQRIKEEVLNAAFKALTFKVDSIVLYQSILKPDGPAYTVLHRAALG